MPSGTVLNDWVGFWAEHRVTDLLRQPSLVNASEHPGAGLTGEDTFDAFRSMSAEFRSAKLSVPPQRHIRFYVKGAQVIRCTEYLPDTSDASFEDWNSRLTRLGVEDYFVVVNRLEAFL